MSGRPCAEDEAPDSERQHHGPASATAHATGAESAHLRDRWNARGAGEIACCDTCGGRLLLSVSEGPSYQWLCTGCGDESGWFKVLGEVVYSEP